MPFKDPAESRAFQARWYLANRDRHRARAAARYKANRQQRLQQIARYRLTARGLLAEIRSSAKRRQG